VAEVVGGLREVHHRAAAGLPRALNNAAIAALTAAATESWWVAGANLRS